MPYIIIPSRRTRQPQGLPRFNAAIPRPAFCYVPTGGLVELARGRAGTKASGDSLRGTRNGLAYKVAHAAGGGLDFGAYSPLTSDAWTMLAFANPASDDGVGALFSQRTNTSPYYQSNFMANSGTAIPLASSPGNLSVMCYNNATSYLGYTSSGAVVDGNWHVFAATRGRNGDGSLIDLYRDGVTLSSTTTGSVVTGIGGTQRVRVGNIGDYAPDAYCANCDFALVAAWDSVLPPQIIARLTPEDVWATLFAPDPRRLYFGAGAGGDTYSLTATGLAGGTPSLQSPALTQSHGLTASNIAGTVPTLQSPALTQNHALTANNLAGTAPTLGAPAVTLAGTLIADDIMGAAPVLANAVLTQEHSLTATAIGGAAPTLGTPALTQNHVVTAANLTGAAAVLGAPTVVLGGTLLADNILGATPLLGSPALTQNHSLTASPLLGASAILGSPAFGQTHLLTGSNIVGIAPQLGQPDLTSGSSGGTGATVEEIVAAVMAELNATAIPVNIRQVNSVPLAGVGSDADPWRAA